MDNALFKTTVAEAGRLSALEDEIALEEYGCTYDELDYDDKETVTFEAKERMEA